MARAAFRMSPGCSLDSNQRPHRWKASLSRHPWGLLLKSKPPVLKLPLFLQMPLCRGREPLGLQGRTGSQGPSKAGEASPSEPQEEPTTSTYHPGPGKPPPGSRGPAQSPFPQGPPLQGGLLLCLPAKAALGGRAPCSGNTFLRPCPAALGSHQPYLQKSVSVTFTALGTHSSSWNPVTTRPINRAAVASLIVQPTGTWNRRSL